MKFSPLVSSLSCSLDCLYKKWIIYYWWKIYTQYPKSLSHSSKISQQTSHQFQFMNVLFSIFMYRAGQWNIKFSAFRMFFYVLMWSYSSVKINKSFSYVVCVAFNHRLRLKGLISIFNEIITTTTKYPKPPTLPSLLWSLFPHRNNIATKCYVKVY